jgi:hypothetical protein
MAPGLEQNVQPRPGWKRALATAGTPLSANIITCFPKCRMCDLTTMNAECGIGVRDTLALVREIGYMLATFSRRF